MRIGYLRVSTQEQKPDRQIDGLQAICDELHIEKLSGASTKRPVYQAVIDRLGAGDTLVVWSLDRAYRSTVDAVLEVEKLHKRGVLFSMVQFPIDTSTPEAMFVYTLVAAFAELERKMISRRTKEGLASAKRRGKRLGRPPKVGPDDLIQARERLKSGRHTISELAAALGIAPWTLTRALRRL